METNIQPDVPITGDLAVANTNPPQPSVPIGAKIIAILHYLVSIFLIFVGILLAFVGAWTLSSIIDFFGLNFGLGLGILPGLVAIVWGLMHFATGRGLWMGKAWGQILAITISGLYIAVGVINLAMFGGANYFTYIGFALHVIIILYLLFSKKIRAVFPYGNSGKMGIILAVVAILIYGSISTASIIYKNKAIKFNEDFVTGLKEDLARTDQAIKESGMDCKFYEYKISDDKYQPLKIEMGNGIYSNSVYLFQINIPQAYTLKELRGSDYCEHAFVFYESDNPTSQNGLMAIHVKPAKGDLNYYFDKHYKYEKNPQKSDTQISGQPAMKITAGPYGSRTATWYNLIYEGKLFTIENFLKTMPDEQFNATAASFQLTKGSLTTPSQSQYFQIKEWGVEFPTSYELRDLIYEVSPTKDFVSFSTLSLGDLQFLKNGGKSTFCSEPKNNPVGGIAGDSQMIERYSSQYKTIGDEYFYRFITPQAACSDDKEVQLLAEKITNELVKSFQGLRKTSTLGQ